MINTPLYPLVNNLDTSSTISNNKSWGSWLPLISTKSPHKVRFNAFSLPKKE